MINWKVRVKNKSFWIALIPAILVLVQVVVKLFGVTLDLSGLAERLLDVVNAVFVVFSILGIVNDPTTPGLEDSNRAKGYVIPGESGNIERSDANEDNDD